MGNYMSAKGLVVTGIILAGFIGFIVGVPSYQMVYTPAAAGNMSPSFSYFGACDDINQYTQHCHGLSLDFIHCQQGDYPGTPITATAASYTYDPFFKSTNSPWIDLNGNTGAKSNGVDVATCRSMIASEAFGILAIIFSFFALVGAVAHDKGRLGGGACALLASIFGVIALAVFFSAKPENYNNQQGTAVSAGNPPSNKDIADFVALGLLSLGYSTGLQIVGIIASFFGGILAFTGDFGPTGGSSSSAPTSSIHHYPHSSTAGTEMTAK